MNVVVPPVPAGGTPERQGPQHPVLRDFLDAGDYSHDALDALLGAHALPLAEPGALTFVWRGEAERVELMRWIHSGIDRHGFTRLPDSELWTLRMPAQDNGRFEYKLGVSHAAWRGVDHRSAQPGPGRRPFRRELGRDDMGLRAARLEPPAGQSARRVETLEVQSEVFGETTPGTGLSAAGARYPGRPIRWSSSMTAATTATMPI